MTELDMLIQNLYEANVKGKLSDRQMQRLMTQYSAEQEELEKSIGELQMKIEKKLRKLN